MPLYSIFLFSKLFTAFMKEKLRHFIFDELIYSADSSTFSDDADLLEAGLDSMGIMRLTMFIEETFDVTLPDEEIEPDNVRSFNRLENWIQRHQG